MARKPRPLVSATAAPLKTVHTYPTKNANISLHVFSYPQRVPTFMGGSANRGWGALSGSVDIQVTDASGDRISAIKLTLTATQTITIPKTASTDTPSVLDRMPIDPEETKTKEVILLQLETLLLEPPKNETDRDSDLLPQGRHAYPFTIDLPLVGNKDKKSPPLLPPSCVIEPLLVGPADAKMRQKAKANGKGPVRPAWATVKYQLKVTVQRPGLLKRNLRSYAPFVYLPLPAPAATSLLLNRRMLGAQMAAIVLQHQGDGRQPIETTGDWLTRPLPFLTSLNGPQKLEPERKSGFLSSLFGGPKKQSVVHWHEAWTLSMPMAPQACFPLRSAIPFVVRCATNKPIDLTVGSPLTFTLFRRVRLLTGKKQKPIAVQHEPVADAALRCSVESRGVFRLNGLLSLPPNCVPNFDLPSLALDYYLAVVRVLDGSVVHKESITLACPPPVEPKTAYGPYPSGLAWRSAQQAALQSRNVLPASDESPPLAPRSVAPASEYSSAVSGRQRPSISSMASSAGSSAYLQPQSRRTSEAPSLRSFRSASTDSAHFATAPSSVSHASAGANVGASMGLAGMTSPPPASSAGASGFVHAQSSGNLNAVREQAAVQPRTAAPVTREQKVRRASQPATEAAETTSIASSRTRSRYSSKGAAADSAISSARSSAELDRPIHIHVTEKGAAPGAQSTGRRALFVTNSDSLPSIPAKTASSMRQHADALVGEGSRTKQPRAKRKEPKSQRSSSSSPSTQPPPAASGSRRGSHASSSPNAAGQSRRAERPLLAAAPIPDPPAPVAAPPPPPTQSTPVDPAFLLTNDDLMYGEDMELDLPPSYFEAVYGAGEDEDDA
ncbi:hypothetical protein PaG_05653 [Moesziomyces aphidis]|uniref:Arrestin-like N-terminal domain-containing protein n=1 Tax=Moesziomyces aphidis TaxID=84754 RepID=W3VI73_MOEAP|nr:hypothetical protein PaG_05653 [Moesziomyces aphidis]